MAEKVVKTKKDNKQSKFKKANPIVWFIFLVFSRIFMKIKGRIKWNNKVLRQRNKNEGAIILFNHLTNHFLCLTHIDKLSFFLYEYDL